jgi:Rieske Fe-S protein
MAPTLAACGDDAEPTESATDSSATPEESSSSKGAGGGSGEGSDGGAGGFTTTADIPEGSGAIFADEGVVVTQPVAGEFKGFSNICTHQGCPLAAVTDTINCNCHGSMFSIEDGSVAQGPAEKPLAEVAITVDGDSISLA